MIGTDILNDTCAPRPRSGSVDRTRRSRRPRGGVSSLRQMAVLLMLLGTGWVLASQWMQDRPTARSLTESSAEGWVVIRRPIPLYALTGTDFAKLPLDYAAFRHVEGGGRDDTLVFGDPHGAGPWLHLSLYRLGSEAGAAGSAAQLLARLGRDAGLDLSSIATPSLLPTRFGEIETADLRIGPVTDAMPCLGFRTWPVPGETFRIAGLLCGSTHRPAGRDLLGCVIDRLDLLSAGDDDVLRDLFVAAERRRGFGCQPAPLTPSRDRITWLDANGAAPVFKRLSSGAARQW